MLKFTEMDAKELQELRETLLKKYEDFKSMKLKYDMSRGKPCKEQLDLSMKMMDSQDYKSLDGVDCRNYGGLDGIQEAKELFSKILGAD